MLFERNDFNIDLPDGKVETVYAFRVNLGKKFLVLYVWPRSWPWSWGLQTEESALHLGPISFALRIR